MSVVAEGDATAANGDEREAVDGEEAQIEGNEELAEEGEEDETEEDPQDDANEPTNVEEKAPKESKVPGMNVTTSSLNRVWTGGQSLYNVGISRAAQSTLKPLSTTAKARFAAVKKERSDICVARMDKLLQPLANSFNHSPASKASSSRPKLVSITPRPPAGQHGWNSLPGGMASPGRQYPTKPNPARQNPVLPPVAGVFRWQSGNQAPAFAAPQSARGLNPRATFSSTSQSNRSVYPGSEPSSSSSQGFDVGTQRAIQDLRQALETKDKDKCMSRLGSAIKKYDYLGVSNVENQESLEMLQRFKTVTTLLDRARTKHQALEDAYYYQNPDVEAKKKRDRAAVDTVQKLSEGAIAGELDLDGIELVRKEFASNAKVVANLLQRGLVDELAVLMGEETAARVQACRDLCEAISHNDATKASQSAKETNLMRQDAQGNVPLHYVRSSKVSRLLVTAEPRAMYVRNWQGQTPINAVLAELSEKVRSESPNDLSPVQPGGRKSARPSQSIESVQLSTEKRKSARATQSGQLSENAENVQLSAAKSKSGRTIADAEGASARRTTTKSEEDRALEHMIEDDLLEDLVGSDISLLLCPCHSGVTPAMRLSGHSACLDLEQRLPSWDTVAQVLKQETSVNLKIGFEKLAQDLQTHGVSCVNFTDPVAEDQLPSRFTVVLLVINHWCFGDAHVWQFGRQTATSTARLQVVWGCIKRLFAELESIEANNAALRSKKTQTGRNSKKMTMTLTKMLQRYNEESLKLADQKNNVVQLMRVLLFATKGPAHSDLRPRKPYEAELKSFMGEILERSKVSFDSTYLELNQDKVLISGVTWLKNEVPLDEQRIQPNLIAAALLKDTPLYAMTQLRLDFKMADAPVWRHSSWVADADPKAAFEELQPRKDCENVSKLCHCLDGSWVFLEERDSLMMKLDCLHRRFICNSYTDHIHKRFEDLTKPNYECEVSMMKDAKNSKQLVQQVDQILTELSSVLETTPCKNMQALLRTAGDFVVDSNVVNVVFNSITDLRSFYETLDAGSWLENGCALLRVQNNFHKDHVSPTGFRDLKAWVALDLTNSVTKPLGGAVPPMLVECHLNLAAFYTRKDGLVDLATDILNGKFDHVRIEKQESIQVEESLTTPLPEPHKLI